MVRLSNRVLQRMTRKKGNKDEIVYKKQRLGGGTLDCSEQQGICFPMAETGRGGEVKEAQSVA